MVRNFRGYHKVCIETQCFHRYGTVYSGYGTLYVAIGSTETTQWNVRQLVGCNKSRKGPIEAGEHAESLSKSRLNGRRWSDKEGDSSWRWNDQTWNRRQQT